MNLIDLVTRDLELRGSRRSAAEVHASIVEIYAPTDTTVREVHAAMCVIAVASLARPVVLTVASVLHCFGVFADA